jgi:mxaJ protein
MHAAALLALVLLRDDPRPVLRVCADPNNAPFSHRDGSGFENRIAQVIADELGAELETTWWAQRRGFFRNTLNAGLCDVVIGAPRGLELARTTRSYYRSAYAFVSRRDRGLALRSLDDPRLRTLSIGVQVIGDDGSNAPPAHALARRGVVDNVVGYTVLGDYAQADPQAAIIEAVSRGDIDVAIVWGPLAGPLAARATEPLAVTLLAEAEDHGLAMAFDIAMAVRKDDVAGAAALERAMKKRRRDIADILDDAGVPRVTGGPRP